jgi:hypothetical protein
MRNVLILLPIALCCTAAAQTISTSARQPQICITRVTVIDTDRGKKTQTRPS